MLYAWVLRLMLSLAATEAPAAPWADTYAATAFEMAQATQDPEEIALLAAVGWEESRFSPGARSLAGGTTPALGRWQVSAHWGPPSAATALRVMRLSLGFCGKGDNGLSWYALGGPNPRTPAECAFSGKSYRRMRLARRLLREMPPPEQDIANSVSYLRRGTTEGASPSRAEVVRRDPLRSFRFFMLEGGT